MGVQPSQSLHQQAIQHHLTAVVQQVGQRGGGGQFGLELQIGGIVGGDPRGSGVQQIPQLSLVHPVHGAEINEIPRHGVAQGGTQGIGGGPYPRLQPLGLGKIHHEAVEVPLDGGVVPLHLGGGVSEYLPTDIGNGLHDLGAVGVGRQASHHNPQTAHVIQRLVTGGGGRIAVDLLFDEASHTGGMQGRGGINGNVGHGGSPLGSLVPL